MHCQRRKGENAGNIQNKTEKKEVKLKNSKKLIHDFQEGHG